MISTNKQKLAAMFRRIFGQEPDLVESLPPSGSHRMYYRLVSGKHSVIGAFNEYVSENRAFLSFCRTFLEEGLPVPKIYDEDASGKYYLIEDLGNQSLKDELEKSGGAVPDNHYAWELYRKSLEHLVRFQVDCREKIDYSLCIPRSEFDLQSIMWDLNHFKYFFLKVSGIPFDEQKLEDDFQILGERLVNLKREFFMYRDFQSRNIMIKGGEPWFIDFQGGRRGALQYDPASLLFEAKTALPFPIREELLLHYLSMLEQKVPGGRESFLENYYDYVLIRILQALGTYGLRGWVENKSLFLLSIPWAMKNLEWLISEKKLPANLKELPLLLEKMVLSPNLNYYFESHPDKLRIRVVSFSYRRTLPTDLSGNGGGYVFDCRAIHNPGRYAGWKHLTGRDPEIEVFFSQQSKMYDFLTDVYRIIDRSIESYQSNNYKHLQVAFGCTGGRHRSVFAAEKLAAYLNENHDIELELDHRDLLI